jgi:hypothetical protein
MVSVDRITPRSCSYKNPKQRIVERQKKSRVSTLTRFSLTPKMKAMQGMLSKVFFRNLTDTSTRISLDETDRGVMMIWGAFERRMIPCCIKRKDITHITRTSPYFFLVWPTLRVLVERVTKNLFDDLRSIAFSIDTGSLPVKKRMRRGRSGKSILPHKFLIF